MKKQIFGLAAALALAAPAFADVGVGDDAPKFELQASLAGEPFAYSLEDALADGPVVVYFYPSAYTRGCNIQAREFAVNMEKFNDAGATVIGVSLDSIERLNDFSSDPEYCADKLAVASDEDGAIAALYGVNVSAGREGATDTRGIEIGHGFAERKTFVVDADGKVTKTIDGVSPFDNVQESLTAVQNMD